MWTCVFSGAGPAIGRISHVRTQGRLCARRSVNVGSGILGIIKVRSNGQGRGARLGDSAGKARNIRTGAHVQSGGVAVSAGGLW